jgi:molecular chaperone GrpE
MNTQESVVNDQTMHAAQAQGGDSELHKCQLQVQELHKQIEESKEKVLRVSADFENFRRRMDKERAQWMQTAQSEVLDDLLDVVNDVDRALTELRKKEHGNDQAVWLAGFELIQKSLQKMLTQYEVQEITQVRTFDPQLHEALLRVASPEHQSGDIITVMERGFMLKGNVLRPAKVSVAE